MALARLLSRGQRALEAYEVTVELYLAGGLPAFTITGLPATAVRESKDRVRAALETAGQEYPQRRITAHLGPADVPKDGGRFDLAIAVGVVMAQRHGTWSDEHTELIGELALSGELRPVTGALPAVLAARDAGRAIIVPAANAAEVALVTGAEAYAAGDLRAVLSHLEGGRKLARIEPRPPEPATFDAADLADVRGQAQAKRALLIAASGAHNVLLIGPPGSGKSMLAERFRGLLPPLDIQDMLLVASIASVAGDRALLGMGLRPPFRAPHHTASAAALVGGGGRVRPGEISLAHRGVLFLDELPEFSRIALEALREPLEAGVARISRVRDHVEFPAEFQLIAAMNPCPCGYRGDGTDRCRCTPARLEQYRARISGPLLDRIDLQVRIERLTSAARVLSDQAHSSAEIRSRVIEARARAAQRLRETPWTLMGRVAGSWLRKHQPLPGEATAAIDEALRRGLITMRGYDRVLRVAFTMSDIAGIPQPTRAEIGAALAFRRVTP